MWLYLIIFFFPILAFYSLRSKTLETLFLAIYVVFLCLFVGLSDMFGGYDRYIYGEVFDIIANMTTNGDRYLTAGAYNFFVGERGYVVINIIISFFTENRYIFILIYTAIIYILLFISLKKYAKNYPIALIFFMGLWFFFTFTYLRQVLGAAVVWLSIRYIIKRDLKYFILVLLIAWSIHKSAIIFFPVYFIPIKKYSQKYIISFMVAMIILGLSPIPNSLFNAYGDASIVEMRRDYNASGGFRIAYFLEVGFFLYIILHYYKTIPNRAQNIVMLNLALLFCATLLFFIRSENGGRLSWYFMIGIIVTMTEITNSRRNRKNLVPLMILLCLFLYVRVYSSWQIFNNLYPYKTFLSNGHRYPDYSWENYEYDHHYDKNKLYRAPFRFMPNLNP